MNPHVGARGLGVGTALRGMDFTLPAGSCTAVLGANGSGKSTLLATLAGVISADAGESYCPRPAAYLPEGCPLDGWVTVRRWLSFSERLPGWEPRVAAALIGAPSLPLDRGAQQPPRGSGSGWV